MKLNKLLIYHYREILMKNLEMEASVQDRLINLSQLNSFRELKINYQNLIPAPEIITFQNFLEIRLLLFPILRPLLSFLSKNHQETLTIQDLK